MAFELMWAIDLTHTTHTRAQTGIQQVCRNLARSLKSSGIADPVVFDRYAAAWRLLDAEEASTLEPSPGAKPPMKRSSTWSLTQNVRGRWARLSHRNLTPPRIEGLFCPEIFDPRRDEAIFSNNLPDTITRVAYFYDAIATKFPQWTPTATVDRFPAYMASLAKFSHVACISRSSEQDLLAYWAKSGIMPLAKTSVIALGLREAIKPDRTQSSVKEGGPPIILMVASLEGRKNHLALLEACEALWESGMSFELRLAGMLNRETGTPAADLINQLSSKGRSINWEGAVSNARLTKLYTEADIFAYPSLYEGFGLPVLEALSHGLPVLTTDCGALGELASGGGCQTCDGSVKGIRSGLESLIQNQVWRESLAEEARKRPIRTMEDAAREVAALFQELNGKPSS